MQISDSIIENLYELFSYDLEDVQDRFSDFLGVISDSTKQINYHRINYPIAHIFEHIEAVNKDYDLFVETSNFFLKSNLDQSKKDNIKSLLSLIEKDKMYFDIEVLYLQKYLKSKL